MEECKLCGQVGHLSVRCPEIKDRFVTVKNRLWQNGRISEHELTLFSIVANSLPDSQTVKNP